MASRIVRRRSGRSRAPPVSSGKASFQPRQQRRRRQDGNAGGRQLDRQRQPVQPGADRRRPPPGSPRSGRTRGWPPGRGPRTTERPPAPARDGRARRARPTPAALPGWWRGPSGAGSAVNRSAIRGAASTTCSRLSRTSNDRRGRRCATSCSATGLVPTSPRPRALAIAGKTRPGSWTIRVRRSRRRRKIRRDLGRDLKREAGLADAARPGQRDERNVVPPQQVEDGRYVVLAPDQGRAREGKERGSAGRRDIGHGYPAT